MVRIVVLVLVFVAGSGLAAYVAAWIILPRQDEHRSIARRELNDPRELRILLAVATATLAIVLGLEALDLPLMGTFAWPVLLGVAGMLMVWRGCSPEEGAHLRQLIGSTPLLRSFPASSRRAVIIRIVAGAALVAVGLGGLASATPPVGGGGVGLPGCRGGHRRLPVGVRSLVAPHVPGVDRGAA